MDNKQQSIIYFNLFFFDIVDLLFILETNLNNQQSNQYICIPLKENK